MPAITLWLVLANATLQHQIAMKNAGKVVAACEEFHADKGRYPETLNELVPQYMPSVPRAKYCTGLGEFWYVSSGEYPTLFWYEIPLHGRRIYNFEGRIQF